MAYITQTFEDNKTVLKAEHLQHIEQGIVDLEKNISADSGNYWTGKKMVANGDSIIYGSALTNVKDAFPWVVADILDMECINYSIGGSTVAKPENSYDECYVSTTKWNEDVEKGVVDTSKKYLVNTGEGAPRIYQIMSYNGSSWVGGGSSSTSAARTPLVDRIAAMDTNADVVLISCGSNDFYYNWTPFGEFDANNYRNSGIPENEMSGSSSSGAIVIDPEKTDLGENLVASMTALADTGVGNNASYGITKQTGYFTYQNVPVIGGHTLYIPNGRRGWFLDADADPISTINFTSDTTNFTYQVPAAAAYLSISFKYEDISTIDAAVYQVAPENTDTDSSSTGKSPEGLKETFYDAMHTMCRYLLNTYKDKDIFICTPIKRVQHKGESNGTWDCVFPEDKNNEGHSIKEYRDAIIEICEYYSIPCIDLYTLSGLNPHIDPDMFADKDGKHAHPSKEGHKRLASVIVAYMQALRK